MLNVKEASIMRFTLVFENNQEGIGASYDLLFAPCPIWVAGENEILNLNPHDPYLNQGCVSRLLEKENLQDVKKCVIVIHSIGHGGIKSLNILKNDLSAAGIKYGVIDFDGIK